MFLIYYDEAGDDGYPEYSSDLFVFSAIYMHHVNWKENFQLMRAGRKKIKDNFNLGIRKEIHTKRLLGNKKEYQSLRLSGQDRIDLITEYCKTIASLRVRAINIVINKPAIRFNGYNVLETALTYSLNRINQHINILDKKSNDQNNLPYASRMMVLSDKGREGSMKRAQRKIQVYNKTPSRIVRGESYDNPIYRLLEDTITVDSRDSYFVQISDLFATLIYQHMKVSLGIGEIAMNLRRIMQVEQIRLWLDMLSPVINFEATYNTDFGYGIYCHPLNKKTPPTSR